MKWFEGTIPEAIQKSKISGSLFIVYIHGDDDDSSRFMRSWDEETVSHHHLQANCVAIKLHANSEQGKQFSQIYPVVIVPCVFYIGKNGVPLEVSGGYLQPSELNSKLTSALQLHNAQSETSTPPAQLVQSSNERTEVTSLPSESHQPVPSASSTRSGIFSDAEQAASRVGASDRASEASAGARSSPGSLEEKKERALDLLARKREEKAREQEEKEKQAEINRRKLGQEMGKLEQWKEDKRRSELENSYKKQKEEERLARERVRADIERDRQERAVRFNQEKLDRETVAATRNTEKSSVATDAEAKLNAARMEQSRIQFRLPDGSSVTNTFQSSENLASVRTFILQRLPSSCRRVTLTTVYPKRVFTEADMSSSLLGLGLAPSAILVVLLGVEKQADTERGIMNIVWWILAPLIWLWGAICTFLFAKPLPAGNHPSQSQQTAPRSRQGASNANDRQPNAESSSARLRARKSDGTKRTMDGNIHRLSADDSDEDNATWNGNSTQQM